MNAYHWLRQDMTAGSGDEPPWTVPETRTLPDPVEIELCRYGYHSSPTLFDGLQYSRGPIACLVDVSEPVARDATKQVSRSRTLLAAVDVSRELRLWAADCAEHVLHVYEAQFPGDMRPRDAIATARAFANGKATLKALRNAYYAANAALAAARNATTGAADAADAAIAAAYDAADAVNADARAARVAANAAAGANANATYAARAATYAADNAADERAWQRARFDEIVLPALMAAVTT